MTLCSIQGQLRPLCNLRRTAAINVKETVAANGCEIS
jgi:hypothetical protein